MLKPFLSFLRFNPVQRNAVIEAIALSFIARGCLLFVPFKRFHESLGAHGYETKFNPIEVGRLSDVLMVKKAVEITARRVPWRCMCFEQAITANRMLKRRGIGGTIYLGVMGDEEESIKAHAWTRVGLRTITGAEARPGYHPISAFAWDAKPPKDDLQSWEPK